MRFLIWVTILYCSGYYLSITSTGNTVVIAILAISLLGFIVASFIRNANSLSGRIIMKGNEAVILLLFVITIVLSEFVNGNFIGQSTVKQILVLLVAYAIAKNIQWSNFKRFFVKSMLAIALFAIIGYLFSLSSLASIFPLITNYNGMQYVSGGFFAAINYPYSGISNRMQGLFWEPGLLSTYLVLAILFCRSDYFVKRYRFIAAIAFFSICIILTRSGAGLIMLPIVIILKLFELRKTEISKSLTFLLLLLFAVVVAIFIVDLPAVEEFMEKYLFAKLRDSNNISQSSRWNAIVVDLKLFISRFPFGVGLKGYSYAIKQYSSNLFSSGTSTLTSYLANYGILGIPFLWIWIKGVFCSNRNKGIIIRVGTAVLFLIILSKEPHGSLLFMNCLFMYFLTNQTLKGRNKNEVEC